MVGYTMEDEIYKTRYNECNKHSEIKTHLFIDSMDYLEYYKTSSEKYIDEFNEWFKACKHQNIPFICVEKRKKYSMVSMDTMTTNYNINSVGLSFIRNTFEIAHNNKQVRYNSDFFIGKTICHIHILNEHVKDILDAYAHVWLTHMVESIEK
jgi:hypothetical protein